MKVSIVILNWNGQKYLKQFLPVLIEKTKMTDAEIVVADNASTDESMSLLENEFPKVDRIVLSENYGFAGGYNQAFKLIEAEYFILLNSDVEVTDRWLEPMVEYMDAHPEVAACQPKILSFADRKNFEHAGAAGGFIDKYGFPFCRGRVIGTVEEDEGQYNNVAEVFWATGACLMVRAEAFNAVGGLDDEFFAHMEEIDLCWRLRSRAYKIVCIPESTVYHVGGGTLHVEHPHKTYLNFRNNLLLLYKNLPQPLLKKTLRARFFFDYMAAIQLFVTGKPKNAYAVVKARYDFGKMVKNFEKKRKDNILYSTQTIFPEVLQKSIVIEYFLKGHKKFNQLF